VGSSRSATCFPVCKTSAFPHRFRCREGWGRSPEERQAAAEARARAREGQPEPGDEEALETPSHRPGPMSRHYGGEDVYARRRLIAIGAAIVVVILLFLLIVGC
jgi:hypothetical protein